MLKKAVFVFGWLRWRIVSALLLAGFLLPRAPQALGLVVQGYDSEINDRFRSGFPNAPVPNESTKFIGKGYDWSGVGWQVDEPKRAFALVTPRHFFCAGHWTPGNGDRIAFLNQDGKVRTFTVAKCHAVEMGEPGVETHHSDLTVGTLAETVAASDHIAHYRIANLGPTMKSYIGKKILIYGHPARIGGNEIIEGMMLRPLASEFNYLTRGLSDGMAKTETGDSGSPSFLVVSGELTLVGVHWKNDTDTMPAGMIPEINRVLAADGCALEVLNAAKP